MKFSDYQYVRPDYAQVKEEWDGLTEELTTASTLEEAQKAIKKANQMKSHLNTMAFLYQIRFSINMDDAFYQAEDAFWNENSPKFDELTTNFSNALVDTPFRPELEKLMPKTIFMLAENAKKVFNSSIIELAQAENQLSTDYNNLIASAQIPFNGETFTLPQIGKFASDKEQSVRKAAQEARNAWFEENEAAFDDIYDKMVRNRDDQARLLGYPDYVAMSYDRMNRFGYDREDVARYRKQILDEVVPVAQKYYERQARRNGHEDGKMAYYDLPLEFASGNATPLGTTAEKLATAQKMYHELSSETGSFFDFMVDSDLFDLDSKKGKQSGGYCEFLPEYKAPFIFANYNGTSGDVDVLTHEAGHAFQVYQSRNIEDPDIVWPTIEAAEIFSMSMEFITWPWMENFFGDQVTKYKYSHLLSALEFLPYGVLVDHFQHEVYSHVDWTPADRKACWRELEKLYKPEQDYSESAFLDRGTYWYRQGHIFDVPFYYIDYTLAQVVAFQFWKRFEIDGDREQAWQDYMAVAKTGGQRTFLEIVEAAGLKSPFAEGALHESIQAIDTFLSGITEEELA